MTEPPRTPETFDDPPRESDQGSTRGLAPWQMVIGIIGLILVLVVVLVFVLGGHTPRLH